MNLVKGVVAFLLIGFLLACAGEAPAPEVAEPANRYDEGPNLLSVLRGAVVVDRSGEFSFEYAALFAIDGHHASAWISPPSDIEQWLIAELPVRSRIEAVGLSTGSIVLGRSSPKQVRYEISTDGVVWNHVGTFEFAADGGQQLHEISPREARFIRVTTLTNHGNPVGTYLPTLLATGENLDAYQRPSVAGRWILNDLTAHFREDGHRVFGYVDLEPPMLIDGAWDNRIVRFAWSRGLAYGVGFMTVAPEDGLNGIWWYENLVDPGNALGSPWYGRRVGEPGELRLDTASVAQLHIERNGKFPLFGLIFDDEGRFDAEASRAAVHFIRSAIDAFPQFRVSLEVSEFHSSDKTLNLAKSQRLSSSLIDGLAQLGLPAERLIVTATGSERPYPGTLGPLHWRMYSRVDFSFTAIE
jgi:hypothetical protein